MIHALLYGKLYYLPSDEEIGAEAHPFNDFQFFLDTAVGVFVGCAIAVSHAVESQLAQQLMVIVDIAREGALVFHARVYADLAVFQDMLRIFNELWIERVGGLQPLSRQKNLVRRGTRHRLKARNQHVFVDGTHALVQLEVVRFGKGHGLHGDEFFEGLAVVQLGQLGEAHAEEFVRFQLCRLSSPEGIDHENVFPVRREFRIGLFREVVMRQETVQLGETYVVFGQGHIQQLVAVAELHAYHWPNALPLAFHHEIGGTHGRVDVGQGQDGIAEGGGLAD